MSAIYDHNAFTPQRGKAYVATARYFFGTMYAIYHRLKITGRENIPDTPFVAVANHLSSADPPMLAHIIDRPMAFLAKEELYSVPGVREFCLFYGAISVHREKPGPSTFKAVKKAFAGGWNLGLFIEGTRTKTPGVLGTPHEGPAYFARLNNVPLVPIGIVGTDVSWGKAYAHIGKPIQPGQDLTAKTWEIMEALSELTGFDLPPRKEIDCSV
jgi:1-acyl-sn-glycerol-3-phosphate acyltransferase